MPDTREKLIELLCNFSTPIMLGDVNLMDWEIPTDEIRERLADYLIANGVTFATDNNVGDKWISVKDRLPEREQEVIVYAGNVLKPSVYFYHFWKADMDSWARVTHWMPLPQPPKGE